MACKFVIGRQGVKQFSAMCYLLLCTICSMDVGKKMDLKEKHLKRVESYLSVKWR